MSSAGERGVGRSPESRTSEGRRGLSSRAGGGAPGRQLFGSLFLGHGPAVARPDEPHGVFGSDDREAGLENAQIVQMERRLVAQEDVDAELALRDG